jgi:putative ATP-dependent endonuclease of the OLD family
MKLLKADIKNYRLLHNLTLTFDENATSIVGKNNSGKTSLSSIFNVFLNGTAKSFSFEDFSLESFATFFDVFESFRNITNENKEQKLIEIQKEIPKIQLILTIKYSVNDNWSNIRPLFTSLEESDKIAILFEYAPISTEKFLKKINENVKNSSQEELLKKIKAYYNDYYKINIRPYTEIESTENITREDITNLIRTKFINAQRILDDSNDDSCSKLSKIFHDQFKNENEIDEKTSENFLQAIDTASGNIDEELEKFFSQFIKHLARIIHKKKAGII